MDGVDLAEIVAGAEGERVGVEVFEVVFGAEGCEDRVERRLDIDGRWEAEGVSARGGDVAKVAGPREDVLKDVTMDCSKVWDVEPALYGCVS